MLLSNLPKGIKLTKTAINAAYKGYKNKYGAPGGQAEKNPTKLSSKFR